ncbi:MAG: heavy metal translocating P-type ATPase [Pseudomonadota bacterium]
MSDTLGCPQGLACPETMQAAPDPSVFVQSNNGVFALDLAVAGARCAGCISKIEGALLKLSEVEVARLNLSTGRLRVEWQGTLDPHKIVQILSDLGYRATPFEPKQIDKEKDVYGRKLLVSMAVAGFAMANIMLLSVAVWASTKGEMGESTRALMHLISALIAIPAAFYAGQPFFSSAWTALKQGHANMDVPISLAVLLAVGMSVVEALLGGEHAYFDAAVMLLFFLLIGRWLDHHLRARARSAAQDLLALQAVTATLLRSDGTTAPVSARDIRPEDRLLLAPGDRVPVDGVVVDGASDIDTSFLSGEGRPSLLTVGDKVRAGTIILTRTLTVSATATADTSLLADIARLVEAGQQSKGRFVRLADKASRAYVPIVHSLALMTFLGWVLFTDASLRESVMAAVAVLIITCPCALGLATPAVLVVATSRLFKKGVLVKSGDALERLAKVDHVVFDKTGTLTTGQLQWHNPGDVSPKDVDVLGALARGSRHPIARAVVAHLGGGSVASHVEEVPGQGCQATVDGRRIALGRLEFVGGENLATGTDREDFSASWYRIGEAAPICLLFEDAIRPDAKALVEQFLTRNIRVTLLSGDRVDAVRAFAAQTGISTWFAGQTPEDKARYLQESRERGEHTAMIGDGLNDTAALAYADVSLSPGSAADATQSSADFVYPTNKLETIWATYTMARQTRAHILQNFLFAALYNAVAAPVAMLGWVTPLIAALAMSGSSMVVALNALTMRASKRTL